MFDYEWLEIDELARSIIMLTLSMSVFQYQGYEDEFWAMEEVMWLAWEKEYFVGLSVEAACWS